jgi:hypothetical protein
MTIARAAREALRTGEGVLRMWPAWVPRPYNRPGQRLRLHPDDYYPLGLKRGGVISRWFTSVVQSVVPGAGPDEGLSYLHAGSGKVLFRDAVAELGSDLIGETLMDDHGGWPMYAKFFDCKYPLFHHVHHGEAAARRVGLLPKHEHYFFPAQYNNHAGDSPVSYFGFDPSVSKKEVRTRLSSFAAADGRITELSRAFRLQLETGWYTPAGVVHAPGSLLTYEPQWNSDVFAVWENVVSGEIMDESMLGKYMPPGREGDLDAIMDAADWEKNICPDYRARYFRPLLDEAAGDGWRQRWIVYGNRYVGGKQLTVEPGCEALVRDGAAHGCVVIQGHGLLGNFVCESPTMLRYGQATSDDFFVSADRAGEGARVVNRSEIEPLVILKHFGPDCGMPEPPASGV